MMEFIKQGETKFSILKNNIPNVMKAIGLLAEIQKNHDLRKYHLVKETFSERDNIKDMLQDWRWSPSFDNDGNICDLKFIGDRLGDEPLLFDMIAPYVVNKSFITIHGQSGDWRWSFKHKELCKENIA